MKRSMWVLLAALMLPPAMAEEVTSTPELTSANQAFIMAQQLIADEQPRDALRLLEEARARFPDSIVLVRKQAQLLFDMERLAESKAVALSTQQPDAELRAIADQVDSKFARFGSNYNLAVIYIQKRIDLQDYLTAIAVADVALAEFPDRDRQRDLLTLKGEALYKNNDLEAAEVELRKALRIDPLNEVAKRYVEEIRSTLEAQTSTQFAEWMSIFRDKVGDFIVTFLALFAAFIANALVEPLSMKIRLNRARRSFEKGDYDDFTDLIEGLLDNEDFSPLRANLRYVLQKKGYEEVRDILDKYVVTVDRLPSLQRLLEREHEKLLNRA